MARRHRYISRRSFFTSLLVLGVITLFIPHSYTRFINDAFENSFRGLLSAGPRINPWENIGKGHSEAVSKEAFAKLQAQYDLLRTEYANTLARLSESNRRLSQLAAFRNELPEFGTSLLLAKIVNSTLDGTRRELVINQGSDAGVTRGQYVLGGTVMVGTVAEVTSKNARVRLVTDRQQNIEVLIRRNGSEDIRGQLFGDGMGKCKIKLLPREHKVREGDIVYAARNSRFLETPAVIGTIASVKPDEQKPLLWDITVEPSFRINELEDVKIVIMMPDLL